MAKKKVEHTDLPLGLRITPSNCRHFSGALHASFHMKAYALIDGADRAKLHISDALMKQWKALIDLETDVVTEATASVLTDRLAEHDRRRDVLLTHLFDMVYAQVKSPAAEVAEAARRLRLVVKPFRGIQYGGTDVESALIQALIVDLRERPTDVETLGLSPVIAELEAVSNAHSQLIQQRRAERVKNRLPSARKVRPQTDAVYALVCQYVEASYLLCTVEKDRQEMAQLIALLNAQVRDSKRTFREIEAQRRRRKREAEARENAAENVDEEQTQP